MKNLNNYIQLLSKEEIRNFKLLTDRLKLEDRKQLVLFDLIQEGYEDDAMSLSKTIYRDSNPNAYYRLKNLLVEDVERSLLFLHYDKNTKNTVVSNILMYQIYRDKGNVELAHSKLNQLEKLIIKNELTEHFEWLYNEMIVLSREVLTIDTELYIAKLKEFRSKAQKVQDANHQIILWTNRLLKINYDSVPSITKSIEKVLKQLRKINDDLKLPDLEFKIFDVARNDLLQKKKFKGLYNYLHSSYQKFEHNHLYTRMTHRYKLSCLFWIVNSAMKSKRWRNANKYLEILDQNLAMYDGYLMGSFEWYYIMLKATYMCLTNQLSQAKSYLKFLLNSEHTELSGNRIFVLLNLSCVYFYESDVKNANKILAMLQEKAIYKEIDHTTKLYLQIYEAILLYESEEYEYLGTKINSIIKGYKADFEKNELQKHRDFLKILYNVLKRGDYLIKKDSVQLEFEKFLDQYQESEVAGNEIIDCVIWCRSKIYGTHYYSEYLTFLNA